MKQLLIESTTLLLLLTVPAAAQDTVDLILKADELYRSGDFGQSAAVYEKAVEAGADSPYVLYNTACSSALAGRTDAAFRWLNAALDRGYRNVEYLKQDDDFKSLHIDERWAQAVKRCANIEADYLQTIKKPELLTELLEMMRVDQEVRSRVAQLPQLDQANERESPAPQTQARPPNDAPQEMPAPIAAMIDVDARHTARMKEIVTMHGWPTKSMVGAEGANAAWLLVQHADADVQFQRRCLELMQKAADGEIAPADLAYLTDRVLVNEGKKQRYGTQFWLYEGKMVPRPIEDEAGLDKRRREAGLSPMGDYTQLMTRQNGKDEVR